MALKLKEAEKCFEKCQDSLKEKEFININLNEELGRKNL